MISDRCRGRNLLNHCRQMKTPKDLNISYSYNKEKYSKEWECILSFNSKEGEYIEIKENSRTKNMALNNVLSMAEPVLRLNLI